jgi:hypothetical protein
MLPKHIRMDMLRVDVQVPPNEAAQARGIKGGA